jgi:hypothetical protein
LLRIFSSQLHVCTEKILEPDLDPLLVKISKKVRRKKEEGKMEPWTTIDPIGTELHSSGDSASLVKYV